MRKGAQGIFCPRLRHIIWFAPYYAPNIAKNAGAAKLPCPHFYRYVNIYTDLTRNVARKITPITQVAMDISFILPVHRRTIINVIMPIPIPLDME